jgi:hypothetical protein
MLVGKGVTLGAGIAVAVDKLSVVRDKGVAVETYPGRHADNERDRRHTEMRICL